MEAILRGAAEVTVIMKQIASASEEQNKGISQVSVAITQMDSVTQQNAALVEQVSAAAWRWKTNRGTATRCNSSASQRMMCNTPLLILLPLQQTAKRLRQLKRMNGCPFKLA